MYSTASVRPQNRNNRALVPERDPEYVYGPPRGLGHGGVAERSKAAVLKTAEG